jgi:hypothetical protein
MLEKRPEERPGSMEEVRELLQAAIYELVELGLPGSEYLPPAHDWNHRSGKWETVTVSEHTIRITGVIQRIIEVAPQSVAAQMIAAMPEGMSGSLLSLALWGVVQHDLLENEPESEGFRLAVDQTLLLTQAVLESNPGDLRTRNQNRFFRGIDMVIGELSKERARILIRELRPLGSNRLFPSALLPKENSGSWSSIRALLSTELSLSSFSWRNDRDGSERDTARDHPAQTSSLMDKLKQDVSLSSMRAVLLHDLSGKNEGGSYPEDEVDIQVEDD